jgi:hypothetical protein
MALVVIKEDGTGRTDANSYATMEDGDAYFEGHAYPTPGWFLFDKKLQTLVMATRLIDAFMQFNGFKAHKDQALQWPRERCPDPDQNGIGFRVLSGGLVFGIAYIEPNVVPKAIQDATCELARELGLIDRTAANPGEGLSSVTTGAGASFSSTWYDKTDTRHVLSKVTMAMLSKYGTPIGKNGGAVKLTRS